MDSSTTTLTASHEHVRGDVQAAAADEVVAEIAVAMEPYLFLGDQHVSGAEWSVPVNTHRWARYLAGFPNVEIIVEDGKISRAALLRLADKARRRPGSEACLTVFFNVLAWGIAGNWRNVSRITTAVAADPQRIVGLLVDAAQAAYSGDPRTAYRTLAGQVPSWGPAFFTKYLHFTSDPTEGAGTVPCLILDDRVRVAWRCLAGEWLDQGSSADYQRYCQVVAAVARRRGSEPAWVEGRLYQFGRSVGTYERFADAQLALCRQRLTTGFPTAADTWHAITTPTGESSGTAG